MKRNLNHNFRWRICCWLAMAACGFAPIAARAQTVLLKNATVHPVSGPVLSPGDVLIENGKVTQVGHLDVQADKVIDLTGQHLYPGLILLNTALGLSEIEAVRATADYEEVGQFVPEVQSWVAVNPDSELLPVTRANGIAFFEPTPEGSMIAGQSGLMAMDGWTTEEMVFKKSAALHVYWPAMEINPAAGRGGGFRRGGRAGGSAEEQIKERERKVKELADFFADARAYAQARDAARTNGVPDPGLNPSWEAMRPYLKGERPIMVHAEELRQIKSALKWAGTNNLKIVIVGGRDAWKAADLLAKSNVPVIYDAIYDLPLSEAESYDIHFKAPELLRQAGVKVALSLQTAAFDAAFARNLPYVASQAVAYGLPAEEGLKAITLYPAQILGVEGRLGTIEPGKDATLFTCTGGILDLRANVTRLWVAGREVSLDNRHARLYEKYRNRPKPH
ncbi:MAG TPA: amidohydrolase family protein [Verrucomicrobiae bacterium]|nr:amidohydrolase family protein [Verrucomicrobiae bacterium]